MGENMPVFFDNNNRVIWYDAGLGVENGALLLKQLKRTVKPQAGKMHHEKPLSLTQFNLKHLRALTKNWTALLDVIRNTF